MKRLDVMEVSAAALVVGQMVDLRPLGSVVVLQRGESFQALAGGRSVGNSVVVLHGGWDSFLNRAVQESVRVVAEKSVGQDRGLLQVYVVVRLQQSKVDGGSGTRLVDVVKALASTADVKIVGIVLRETSLVVVQ